MDFIYTADHALPDSLCDELIARFESHPDKHAGVTSSGVAPGRKTSVDLTIDKFQDMQGIHQRVLNDCVGHLADYFMRYPFVGSIYPTIRMGPTGPETELTMDNIGSVNRDTVKMLVTRLMRCGTVNIQKYAAGTGGYPHWHCEISPEETSRDCTAWCFGCIT